MGVLFVDCCIDVCDLCDVFVVVCECWIVVEIGVVD